MTSLSLPRMASSRSISFSSSASSFRIFSRSRPGQALQLHVEDRLRLDLRQAELRDESFARHARICGASNQRDHRVEVIERDLQPFQDVPARFGLAELELRSSTNDLAAELDEVVEDLEERQHLRPAADDRQHDDAERRLQLRVLVEIVEDDLADLAALQVDDDAKAVAIGFVADVGDALEHFLAHQFGDALDQPALLT